MSKFSRTVSVIALLGFSVGIASAAPSPKKASATKSTKTTKSVPPSKPKPSAAGSCTGPSPSAATCFSRGYVDSACGKRYAAECRHFFEQKLEDGYEANPSREVKMLKVGKDELPRDLRDGKVVEYYGPKDGSRLLGTFPKITTIGGKKASVAKTGPKTTIKQGPVAARSLPLTGSQSAKFGSTRSKPKLSASKTSAGMTTMTSDNIFARTGLTRPPFSGPTSGLPTQAHRMPAWEANGQKVASCEEFGYEQVYDWARYTDAVAACSGDLNCQLDIAFLPVTPGIASRTLKRKDGRALASQIKYVTKKKLPKNDFFAFGSKFAYAGGPDGVAKTPNIDALSAALNTGDEYYEIGCTGACGTKGFSDEWDFHRDLHDRNRTVTNAEFEEYERRKARFRELASQWTMAVNKEKAEMLNSLPKDRHVWVNPMDMVTSNPIERFDMMEQAITNSRTAGRAFQKKKAGVYKAMPGAGVRNKAIGAPLGGKAGGKVRGKMRGQQVGALDLDGPPPLGVMASVKPGGGKPGATPNNNAAKPNPATTIQCMPSSFPSTFEALGMGPISCQIGFFLREEWARKAKGYKSCLDLDDDDCDWSPMMFEARFTKGVPYIEEQNEYEVDCVDYTGDTFTKPLANLVATEDYIKEMKGVIGAALTELKPYNQGSTPDGKRFGKAWTDADHFGDKDWFAAGYDYDMGWDIVPVKSPGSDVCQLGGGARGGFGIDGWFIGNEFEVVDGLAKGDYNRKGDKYGHLEAHLRVFSVDMFDEVDENFQGSWGEPLVNGTIQIPTGYKPSFTFMAGPVPITGAVWGEFFYGARLDAELISETNPNCDMEDVKLGATATFTPELGLNAKAQVGIGISGLLSAGIRGMVNLVTIGVPVRVALTTKIKNISQQAQVMLGFDLDVLLSISTLSGWIAVYVEVLIFEEEFIIFRWNGLGPEMISLLGGPLQVELPVFSMK